MLKLSLAKLGSQEDPVHYFRVSVKGSGTFASKSPGTWGTSLWACSKRKCWQAICGGAKSRRSGGSQRKRTPLVTLHDAFIENARSLRTPLVTLHDGGRPTVGCCGSVRKWSVRESLKFPCSILNFKKNAGIFVCPFERVCVLFLLFAKSRKRTSSAVLANLTVRRLNLTISTLRMALWHIYIDDTRAFLDGYRAADSLLRSIGPVSCGGLLIAKMISPRKFKVSVQYMKL